MTVLQRIVAMISPRPNAEKSEHVQRLSQTQKKAREAAEELKCGFTDAERMLRKLLDGADGRDRNAR